REKSNTNTLDQPHHERDESLPPPATPTQPGRLVSVGRGGAHARARGGQAHSPLRRLRGLPLVPVGCANSVLPANQVIRDLNSVTRPAGRVCAPQRAPARALPSRRITEPPFCGPRSRL